MHGVSRLYVHELHIRLGIEGENKKNIAWSWRWNRRLIIIRDGMDRIGRENKEYLFPRKKVNLMEMKKGSSFPFWKKGKLELFLNFGKILKIFET